MINGSTLRDPAGRVQLIRIRSICLCAAAALTAALLPSAAYALPEEARIVANAQNTGVRVPASELRLVTDTTIDEWGYYERVRFPVGRPVVVGAAGASFQDVLFPSGLIFDGTDSISTVDDSTVVGGVVLSSTRGVYLFNVEVANALVGVDVVGDQGRPSYNTGLSMVWVHRPRTQCGRAAVGVHARGAQGFLLDGSTIDMGGWQVGCGGSDLVHAAFDADDGWDGNSQLGIFGTNLNGGAITFQRGTFADLDDGFTVQDTWIGPDYHYAAQGFPPIGPAVASVDNAQVTPTAPHRLRPLLIH